MFKDLLGEAFPVIEKFAPTIATVLGSPLAGTATYVAMNALRSAFNLKDAAPSQIVSEISSNSQSESILKNMENNFAEMFKNSGILVKMPSSIEINLKMSWENQSQG